MNVERICQYHCECGEGPMWHVAQQCLYWVDIPTGRLFRYDPVANEHEMVYQGRPIGGFTVQRDGALLLFRDRGTVDLYRDGQIVETIIDEIPDERTTRFNDVCADPEGRVFCGTMPVKGEGDKEGRLGRLYRLDADASLRIVAESIGCSNGIGYTPDLTRMYYTDSPARTIWLYDYDRATGGLTHQRPFVTVPEGQTPDGMTVDADGGVWSAHWGGSCVMHYGPDGKFIDKIDLPTAKITSVMFGGKNLDELYITSAIGGSKDADPEYAGALYRVRPGVTGREEFLSRIGL